VRCLNHVHLVVWFVSFSDLLWVGMVFVYSFQFLGSGMVSTRFHNFDLHIVFRKVLQGCLGISYRCNQAGSG
jgi:hypothetical protein